MSFILEGKRYEIHEVKTSLSAEKAGDFWQGRYCPKCGATLLINGLNDVWCSFTKCTFGLKGSVKAVLLEVES